MNHALSAPDKWQQRFLDLADHISHWSQDPSTKVGAVIARSDRTIVSLGFNGMPRGCSDDPVLYQDRPVKYARVVHAEVNAILMARENLADCTLYVSPLHPCSTCAGIIIQSGIKRVVAHIFGDPTRWEDNFREARRMFQEAGVATTVFNSWE
jgi:dCMP deaminase